MITKPELAKELRLTRFLAASLGLAVTGLVSQSAQAQTTWTGSIDQNFADDFNWSNGVPSMAGANMGGYINEAADTFFPIIDSSVNIDFGTNVDLDIGQGAGMTGRLDQTGGSIVSTGWIYDGHAGGTGTFNQSGGTFAYNRLYVGSGDGSTGTFNQTGGTLTVDQFWQANGAGTMSGTTDIGGTLNANQVFVSHGDNATAISTGTMNVNSGGVVNSENDFVVAFAGALGTVGTANVFAGGTVNVGTMTERWLMVNRYDSAEGHLNVSGTVNLGGGTDITTQTNGIGNSVINVDGGSIVGSGAVNLTDASIIKLHRGSGEGSATVTIQHGGSIEIQRIDALIAGAGSSVVNFDNGTLRAIGDEADFIKLANSTTHSINILAGGAKIDSNGFNIGINEEMSGSGGLIKLGAGQLTLTGMNTYMGDTSIYDGTLSINTAYLADGANVGLVTGATFALDFAGTDTINALIINGVPQAAGTWGAPGSGAANETTFFSGTGILDVTSSVPEPGTLMLVLGGGASMLLLARRRNRRG